MQAIVYFDGAALSAAAREKRARQAPTATSSDLGTFIQNSRIVLTNGRKR